MVDQPSAPEGEELRDAYFAVFPDGRDRQHWPGLIYLRAKPHWLRYSDFRTTPPTVMEFTGAELNGIR
jgi:hypothetical protein